MRTSRFGEYLLEKGVLDRERFEEACLSQSVLGGRIGSNLVELGYVGLDELTRHLAEYQDIEAAPEDWLEAPDPKALAAIPKGVIRRFSVLPLRLEPDQLHVAMLDPHDANQLATLRDLVGRPVTAYAVPEVRLCFWLEIHCRIDRHPRYANIVARRRQGDDEERASRDDFEPLPKGEDLSTQDAIVAAPPSMPLDQRRSGGRRGRRSADEVDDLVLEEIVLDEEVSAAVDRDAERPPASPGEIAMLEAQLEAASDRGTVIDLSLRLATAFAPSVALLVVRGEMVAGLRAIRDGRAEALDGVLLPTELESLFTQPIFTGRPFRGRPPCDGVDGRIKRAIGRPDAAEVLIHPVAIQGRVVNLLYADNGVDPLAETCVAALGALAATMTAAYTRLITEMKRG